MKWYSYISSLALGVLVAIFGTIGHRSVPPYGLIMALACVVFAAISARYLFDWSGLAIFGFAWIAIVQTMALFGPGGSVLIPDISNDLPRTLYGYIWMYGGIVAVMVAVVLPGRWLDASFAKREESTEL